jgi:hypothetical protein
MKVLMTTTGKIVLILAILFATPQFTKTTHAQEQGIILSMTEFTIKNGHSTKFQEGVKAWKACYLENDGEWEWNVWYRSQGESNVYTLTSVMMNWAEMDEVDEAGRACRDISRELINPHVEKAVVSHARHLPARSSSNPFSPDENVVRVTSFQVKNFPVFQEILAGMTDAMRRQEGNPRGHWYSVLGGGPESADYMLVMPFKGFAGMDVSMLPPWDVYEQVHGTRKRDQDRARFSDALVNSWSYLYRLVEDMSHSNN